MYIGVIAALFTVITAAVAAIIAALSAVITATYYGRILFRLGYLRRKWLSFPAWKCPLLVQQRLADGAALTISAQRTIQCTSALKCRNAE